MNFLRTLDELLSIKSFLKSRIAEEKVANKKLEEEVIASFPEGIGKRIIEKVRNGEDPLPLAKAFSEWQEEKTNYGKVIIVD